MVNINLTVFLCWTLVTLVWSHSNPFWSPRRKGLLTNAILFLSCGVIDDAPANAPLSFATTFSPWMVILMGKTERGANKVIKCGATLVSPRHAITSANCLKKEDPLNLEVVIGADNFDSLSYWSVVSRKVQKVMSLSTDQRIAILEFLMVFFCCSVRPICIIGNNDNHKGTHATLGWQWPNRKSRPDQNKKEMAFLSMKSSCDNNGCCATVLNPEEYWEMTEEEIPDGAPLMVLHDSHWYIKGLIINEEEQNKQMKSTDYRHFETKKVNKKKKKKETKVQEQKVIDNKKKEPENKPKKNESQSKDKKQIDENQKDEKQKDEKRKEEKQKDEKQKDEKRKDEKQKDEKQKDEKRKDDEKQKDEKRKDDEKQKDEKRKDEKQKDEKQKDEKQKDEKQKYEKRKDEKQKDEKQKDEERKDEKQKDEMQKDPKQNRKPKMLNKPALCDNRKLICAEDKKPEGSLYFVEFTKANLVEIDQILSIFPGLF